MKHAYNMTPSQKVWVVFSGQTELSYLKWLKPGFRHCYVVMNDGERWVTIDPLSHFTDVTVHHHLPLDFNLPRWLEARGMKVVAVNRGDIPLRAAPLMVFTCVEAVKRILGIHDRFVFTPWQLYRRLTNSTDTQFKGEISWAV